MTAVTFDTLEYVNALKKAQVPDDQAQAQAKALRQVLEVALTERSSESATKADVDLLRKDVEALENRLIIKLSVVMVGILGVVGGITATVVRLMLP